MPVYNTANFIPKSVGSVLNQKYQNLELICVNDGSTDNSLQVLETFAAQDKRIKIINKKNEGVAVARNIGIDESTGSYICFIDSDDAMPENAIQAMIDALKVNPTAKYIKGNNLVTRMEGNTVVTGWSISRKQFSGKLLSSEDFWHYIDLTRPCIWGILFDLAYIRANNLKFNKNIDFGEDALFLAQYIDGVPGVYLDEPTYDYLIGRQGSLCDFAPFVSKNFIRKKIIEGLILTKNFYELKVHTHSPYRIRSMDCYLNWFVASTLSYIIKSERFKRGADLKTLKTYYPKLVAVTQNSVWHKCLVYTYNFCYKLLNIIP